jgi:MerR family transcriptional regulator, thiopeptide resistance regulator
MVRREAARGGLTVSAFARKYGLARSTLLHYHRLQLLTPTGRSAAGYRLYGPEADARLQRIVELREAGLSLPNIRRVLDSGAPLAEVLEEQIGILNRQVAALRAQQRVVLSLLELSARRKVRTLDKERWTGMFRAIGLTDAEMHRWHANFEKTLPEAHADFLRSLGLEEGDVRRIRAWSAG